MEAILHANPQVVDDDLSTLPSPPSSALASRTISSTSSSPGSSSSATSSSTTPPQTGRKRLPAATPALSSTVVQEFKNWGSLDTETREKCIGLEPCKYKYGDMHAWPAAGILRTTWNQTISKTISDILNDEETQSILRGFFRRRRKVISLIPVLFLLSSSSQRLEATPHVVFLCSKKYLKASLRAIQVLEEHKCMQSYDFGYVREIDEITISASDTPVLPGVRNVNQDNSSLCGRAVRVCPFPCTAASKSRLATVGGVLKAGPHEYFAVTCAHVFFDFPDAQGESDNDSDLDSDSESTKSSNSNTTRSQSPIESPTPHGVFRPLKSSPMTSRQISKSADSEGQINTATHVGNAFATSIFSSLPTGLFFNRELDWALVQILDPRLWCDNEFHEGSLHARPHIGRTREDPPDGDVLIVAELLENRTGKGLGTKSAINLPWTRGFVEVWAIECESGPGVCGAWVIEPESEIVLGIVVAHSRISSLTWILPANEIFADIKSRWEARGMRFSDLAEVSASELSPKHLIEHHTRDLEKSVLHRHLSVDRRTNNASTSNTINDLPKDPGSNSEVVKTTTDHAVNRGEKMPAFGAFRQSAPQKDFSGLSSPLRLTTNEQDRSNKRVDSGSKQNDTLSPIVIRPRNQDYYSERHPVGDSGPDLKHTVQTRRIFRSDHSIPAHNRIDISHDSSLNLGKSPRDIDPRSSPAFKDLPQSSKSASEHAGVSQGTIVPPARRTRLQRDRISLIGSSIPETPADSTINHLTFAELVKKRPSVDAFLLALDLPRVVVEFIKIPAGAFTLCRDFIQDNRKILTAKDEYFHRAALRARNNSSMDSSLMKQCIQRWVLVRSCRNLTPEGIDQYLDTLTSENPSHELNAFFAACDRALKGAHILQSINFDSGQNGLLDPVSRSLSGKGSHSSSSSDSGYASDGLQSVDGNDVGPSPYIKPSMASSYYKPPPATTLFTRSYPTAISPFSTSIPDMDSRYRRPPRATPHSSSSEPTVYPTSSPEDPIPAPSRSAGAGLVGKDDKTLLTVGGLENVAIRGHLLPDAERLDPTYHLQRNARNFFNRGRVFAFLMHEPKGQTPLKADAGNEDPRSVTTGPKGEKIYSALRKMAVIRQRHGYCICVPINSYRSKSLGNKNMSMREMQAHAIVYSSRQSVPNPLEGDPHFVKRPIAVDLAPGQALDAFSRIHFGKTWSVEWNVKVKNIGHISDASMPFFEAYWREELVS